MGDAYSQTLIEFDKELNFVKKGNVKEGAVNLKETSSEILLTVMGSFSPTDNPSGFLLGIPKNDPSKSQILIDSLQRPVYASYADLNQDGRMDLVVSEYGKWTGKLSLYLNEKEGFKQKTLINEAGATRTYLKDFNQDGLLDIAALFGQGNEGIYILYNQGNGNFKPEQVLQFSASNGSSYFDVVDYNKDGFLDGELIFLKLLGLIL